MSSIATTAISRIISSAIFSIILLFAHKKVLK